MLRFSCVVSRECVPCFLILGLLCRKQTQITCITFFGAHDEENISFRFVCFIVGSGKCRFCGQVLSSVRYRVTTDPAAAEAVLKQAREIQMQDAQPASQKVNKARYGKKKTKVRKTKTVTEETSVQ